MKTPRLSDYLQEAEYPEQLYMKFQAMPGSPTWLLSTRVRRLDAIIEKLRQNAYAPTMKIFGSASEDDGKIPDDIRIFVDTSSLKLSKEIAIAALKEIIEISSNYRGLLFPYILVNKKLYTRDTESTKWVNIAKNAGFVSSARNGLPISLFKRNFSSIAYKAISESDGRPRIMDYVSKVESSSNAKRMFCGCEVPAKLFEHYTEWEIALMLGGH